MENLNALKARAYDLIALIEGAQNELAQVNQAIMQAMQATVPATPTEPTEPSPASESVS